MNLYLMHVLTLKIKPLSLEYSFIEISRYIWSEIIYVSEAQEKEKGGEGPSYLKMFLNFYVCEVGIGQNSKQNTLLNLVPPSLALACPHPDH